MNYFLTFGAPFQFFSSAVSRLCYQAKEFGLFDAIYGYDERVFDMSFCAQHGEFILTHPRGFGYWLWKPYIIRKLLSEIAENDVVVYADAGCVLNIRASKRMSEYIELAKQCESGIVGFQLQTIESHYTKMDTIAELHAFDHAHTPQILASVCIIRKTPISVELVERWFRTCEQYRFLDDRPSELPNAEGFVEHRHDQSIWSLLLKQTPGVCILPDETYFAPEWKTAGIDFPIWAMRNTQVQTIPM